MMLQKYLEDRGESLTDFARRSGIPVSNIWRLVHQPWRSISAAIALRIQDETGGAVSLEDMVIVSKYRRPRGSPGPLQASDPDGARGSAA